MSNEIIDILFRLNLALAAGVLVVLTLRMPMRRWFGARIAYALWLIPIAAALMCFAPGRVETIILDIADVTAAAEAEATPAIPSSAWTWAWAFGALVSLSILTIRQARFTQSLGRLGARDDLGKRVCTAQSIEHGPAVIGVLRPMIVTPADFDARFDAEERRLVLAHEHAHLAHGDPWINAVVLALQCLNWFNPFVHIGARMLRIDQELACDAAVLANAEGARRRYAEAMLKTHISAAVPIGCAWPASDIASFKERIAMLKRNLPSRKQTLLGAAAILVATGAVAAVAWAAQPARVVATYPDSQRTDVADLAQPADLAGEDLIDGDFDIQLDGDLDGDGVIVIDGKVMHARDLTPEQREELRRSMQDAHEQMVQAREQMQVARQAIRDAMRNNQDSYDLSDDDIESIREALADVRLSQEEEHRARAEAIAEAHQSMREAQIELAAAQAAMQSMPDVRVALREAEVELTRAMEEARANGHRARAEALEQAAAALDEADDASIEDSDLDIDMEPDVDIDDDANQDN